MIQQKRHYNFLCREIKRQSQLDKDCYLRSLYEQVEKVYMQKKSKEIYDGLRRITGKRAQKVRVIKDKNGKVLTDQDQVKNRWREHFQELYNPQTVTDPSVLMEMPVGGRNGDPTAGLTIEEVQAAIHRLKKHKVPGADNTTADEIQGAGNAGVELLLKLCQRCWREERFPQLWTKSVVVPIHKKKDKLSCDNYNYRGASLLSHCGKVMTSIILQRIRLRTEEILSEAQAGFRAGRSTIDQLFTLRRLAETYIEFSKYLYVCYVDFKKAFDSVW